MKRLLVAEELSHDPATQRRSDAVRACASHLAKALHLPIDLVHVDDFDFSPIQGRPLEELLSVMVNEIGANLEEVANKMKPKARPVLLADNPRDGLIDLLSGRTYQLAVLGTAGRKGLGRIFLGSVAEEVIRQSLVPVAVLGPEAQKKTWKPSKKPKILFGTDLSPASKPARMAAISLAKAMGAEVEILNCLYEGLHPVLQTAFSSPSAERELASLHTRLDSDARELLERELKAFQKAKIKATTHLDTRAMSASNAVLRTLRQGHHDLVVLGSHSRSFLRGAVLGRTVRDVLLQSPVPVVVARDRSKKR